MNLKIWIGSLIVCVGCGEVTAEPIRSMSLAITNVDIDAESSADPYACEVLRIDASQTEELSPFVRVGDLAYAGRCQNPAPGALGKCWYTGDSICEQEGRECGGFFSSNDPATGDYELRGGQHMLCPYACVQDDQCPAGATGTARPACMHEPEFDPATESGQCMLVCDSGETCPDGFVCVLPGLSFSSSDGALHPAPAQCVQLHRLTVSGSSVPQ